jgi:hypothetical protein
MVDSLSLSECPLAHRVSPPDRFWLAFSPSVGEVLGDGEHRFEFAQSVGAAAAIEPLAPNSTHAAVAAGVVSVFGSVQAVALST